MQRVGLKPGDFFRAIEDVIGGVVDEEDAPAAGLFREDAGSVRIDRHGGVALGFGAIDSRVGGGVEDYVRRDGAHEIAELFGVGEVGLAAIAGDDFAGAGEAALQFASYLACGAEDEDAAQLTHAKTSAERRGRPARSFSARMASAAATGHGMARSGSFHSKVRSPA